MISHTMRWPPEDGKVEVDYTYDEENDAATLPDVEVAKQAVAIARAILAEIEKP